MPSDRNVAADYYADRLGWSQETRIGWHNIGPGKPKHNVFIKRFNDGLRDEPLNQTLFTFFAHGHEVLAVWKDDTVRSGRTAPSATSGLPLTPTSAISRYSETGGWSYLGVPRFVRPVAPPSQCGSNGIQASTGNWMKEEAQVK
jgi:hypothetical protein